MVPYLAFTQQWGPIDGEARMFLKHNRTPISICLVPAWDSNPGPLKDTRASQPLSHCPSGN